MHLTKTIKPPDNKGFILIEVQGNREAIGYGDDFEKVTFKTIELPIFKNDIIYSYTDGYPDQFGGPRNKKFGSKRFKKLLLSIHHLNMNEQKQELDKTFYKWKGEQENLDDVLVMGVRV